MILDSYAFWHDASLLSSRVGLEEVWSLLQRAIWAGIRKLLVFILDSRSHGQLSCGPSRLGQVDKGCQHASK